MSVSIDTVFDGTCYKKCIGSNKKTFSPSNFLMKLNFERARCLNDNVFSMEGACVFSILKMKCLVKNL